jgi:hypothetical protein
MGKVPSAMAMIDRYMQELLMEGDNATEQDAIESAIFNQIIPLSYSLRKDRETIEYEKPQIITHFLRTHSDRNQPTSRPTRPAKSKRSSQSQRLPTTRNPAKRRTSLRPQPKQD